MRAGGDAHQTVDAARGLDFSHLKERGEKSLSEDRRAGRAATHDRSGDPGAERENLVAVLKATGWKVSGPGSRGGVPRSQPGDARFAAPVARHRPLAGGAVP